MFTLESFMKVLVRFETLGELWNVMHSCRACFVFGTMITQKTFHLIFYHPNGIVFKIKHEEQKIQLPN